MATEEIRIWTEAVLANETSYKGVPVDVAFYTAGLPDGTQERILGPLNHATTYILRGAALGKTHDVMVRTGNAHREIMPYARAVKESGLEGDFFVYLVERLTAEEEAAILAQVGLAETYERLAEMAEIERLPGHSIIDLADEVRDRKRNLR